MYINSVFCFAKLGKIIQIVSHHESDSDQSILSGQAEQPEEETDHREQPQEKTSAGSGQAEKPQEKTSTGSGQAEQPAKDHDQEYMYMYIESNGDDDNKLVNTGVIIDKRLFGLVFLSTAKETFHYQ
jgi:hypothetical protein